MVSELIYLCDVDRHLICLPYTVENLHRMAADLNIKRCWFSKGDHYDIPKKRWDEISSQCMVVNKRVIAAIVNRHGDFTKEYISQITSELTS